MKRPAVYFDRDNTLLVTDGYLSDPSQVVLMDGAAAAVARARELGYATVVVSNQSGVARGFYGEGAVHAVNQRLEELLRAQNPLAIIDRHEFCPFHPEATVGQYRQDSDLRKPKPGMLLKAAEALGLDLSRSWMIGDAPRDIAAGAAAGCRTILFQPPNVAASPEASKPATVAPDYTVTTLAHAMDLIARHPDRETDSAAEAPSEPPASAQETFMMPVTPEPTRPPVVTAAPVEPPVAPAIDNPPAPAPQPADQPAPAPAPSMERVESLLEQLLLETRRRREQNPSDFSISKLMAGILQVIVLAVLFFAYLNHNDTVAMQSQLLLAIALEAVTIALLIMGHQR